MKIENPLAYSFILQEDLYLLDNDKQLHPATASPLPAIEAIPVLPEPDIKTTLLNFNYLGENKKGFLIIVYYKLPGFMDEAHLTALTAVLARLQYTIDDVAILNLAHYAGYASNTFIDFFKPQKFLLLGAQALPAGLESIELNKPQKVNGLPALFSFNFEEMMTDNEKKKSFWEQMKQL